jgi:UDP-2,3-diacylglucosamine pyrophosphatase LpxH
LGKGGNVKDYYKTIVLSDIHLGRRGSRHKDVISFLKQSICENLILNGDIVDRFSYNKPELWKKRHWRFIKALSQKVAENNTKITFIKGNSDELPNDMLPLEMGALKLVDRVEYESNGKKFLVVHGDIFDTYKGQFRWLASLGKKVHGLLFWFHHQVHRLRVAVGVKDIPFSEKVNSRLPIASRFIEIYEQSLCQLAKNGGYDGIICGHLHIPAIKTIDGMVYMNSGDWLSSGSALVEYPNGEWKHVFYTESQRALYEELENEEKGLKYLNIYPSLRGGFLNL